MRRRVHVTFWGSALALICAFYALRSIPIGVALSTSARPNGQSYSIEVARPRYIIPREIVVRAEGNVLAFWPWAPDPSFFATPIIEFSFNEGGGGIVSARAQAYQINKQFDHAALRENVLVIDSGSIREIPLKKSPWTALHLLYLGETAQAILIAYIAEPNQQMTTTENLVLIEKPVENGASYEVSAGELVGASEIEAAAQHISRDIANFQRVCAASDGVWFETISQVFGRSCQ